MVSGIFEVTGHTASGTGTGDTPLPAWVLLAHMSSLVLAVEAGCGPQMKLCCTIATAVIVQVATLAQLRWWSLADIIGL